MIAQIYSRTKLIFWRQVFYKAIMTDSKNRSKYPWWQILIFLEIYLDPVNFKNVLTMDHVANKIELKYRIHIMCDKIL